MLQLLVILLSLLLEILVSNTEVGGSSTNGKLTIKCKSKGPIKIAQDGNRELLTVIECVLASENVLPPLILCKGSNQYMGWHQFTFQLPQASEFQFSFSPKGWTCRELGIAWVTGLFDLHTQETLKPRLLIIDGQYSQAHVRIQFSQF